VAQCARPTAMARRIPQTEEDGELDGGDSGNGAIVHGIGAFEEAAGGMGGFVEDEETDDARTNILPTPTRVPAKTREKRLEDDTTAAMIGFTFPPRDPQIAPGCAVNPRERTQRYGERCERHTPEDQEPDHACFSAKRPIVTSAFSMRSDHGWPQLMRMKFL